MTATCTTPTTAGGRRVYAVLVHGWGGSARVWDGIRWPDDWTVLPYELPGHGMRHDDGPFTIPFAAEDLADYIRRTVPAGEQALLIGHSMGGQLTLLVHANHPELVAGEVVIDPALGADEGESARRRDEDVVRRFRIDPYDAMESFIQGAFTRFTSDDVRAAIMADVRRTNAQALADYYQSEYLDPDSIGGRSVAIRLGRRRTRPTFGIYLTPARADFERTGGTRDISIWSGGHGHFMFLEDPTRFVDEVVSWAISRGLYDNADSELRLVPVALSA